MDIIKEVTGNRVILMRGFQYENNIMHLSFTLHDIMNPFKVIKEKIYLDLDYRNAEKTTGNGASKIVASRVNPVFYLPIKNN